MIIDRIRDEIVAGMVIPKPCAKADFIIKDWGKRMKRPALVYKIPNHKDPERPYQKGITEKEFEEAYKQIEATGKLTREWFNNNLSACAKEGSCNFTSIGGIFELLGIAHYSKRGVYVKVK